ncbi:MAG: flagellar hook capping FlgD N-terminal domain-containing protein [Asticcacaulis sp.]
MVTAVGSSTSTTQSTSSLSGLASTYETFLGLLTAQIRNQDPLSPMDSTEWTNQLVQYTSVEQQLKQNEHLATLVAQGATNLNSVVGFIGKTVTADIDAQTLKDQPLEWKYALGTAADTVELKVTNKDGTVIWSGTGDGKDVGENTFVWDGKDSSGKAVRAGDYTLQVTAKTAGGASIQSAVYMRGTVDAAEFIDGQSVLRVGMSLIPLSYITGVEQTKAS